MRGEKCARFPNGWILQPDMLETELSSSWEKVFGTRKANARQGVGLPVPDICVWIWLEPFPGGLLESQTHSVAQGELWGVKFCVLWSLRSH